GKDLSHQPPKSDGLVVLNCTYPFPSGPHTLTMYFAVTPSLEVAVIVVTPTATAVTRPEGFTIATLGSSLFHARVFAASMGGAVAMIWRVFPANRLAPWFAKGDSTDHWRFVLSGSRRTPPQEGFDIGLSLRVSKIERRLAIVISQGRVGSILDKPFNRL